MKLHFEPNLDYQIRCGEVHFTELAKDNSPAAQFLKATKLNDLLAQC